MKAISFLLSRHCAKEEVVKRQRLSGEQTPVWSIKSTSSTVARVVEIINVQVLGLSILSLGKFKFLNSFAHKTLRVPALVKELFAVTLLCVNSSTKFKSRDTAFEKVFVTADVECKVAK